jgi:hypothetical protein
MLAYTHLKEVVLLNGRERVIGSAVRADANMVRYSVTKVNKWGKKQQRILSVDAKRK